MKIQHIIFLTFVLLIFSSSAAQAVNFTATGNPGDTLAGTVITAVSTEATLNYTDVNGNPKPEVNPVGDITITVLPVYGFSVGTYRAVDVPARNSNFGYINQTRYLYTGITNEGNVSDTYIVTAEFSTSLDKGAGTWVVEAWRDNAPYGTTEGSDVLIGTLTEGTSTTEIVSVAEDASYYYYLKVVYPDNTANADDRIITGGSVKTSSTPVGQYTGANGLTYAGTSEFGVGVPVNWRVCRPLLTLNRRDVYVDAPLKPPYGGNATDAVPGSIISYSTQYSVAMGNQYCTAESVIFIDKIPANTHLAHINKGTNGGNTTDHVKLTNDNTKASGSWTIWYTTQDPPTTTNYGEYINWTMIGTLPADAKAYFPPTSATYSVRSGNPETGAKWIKWERAKIDPYGEQLRTINWGVTIR